MNIGLIAHDSKKILMQKQVRKRRSQNSRECRMDLRTSLMKRKGKKRGRKTLKKRRTRRTFRKREQKDSWMAA